MTNANFAAFETTKRVRQHVSSLLLATGESSLCLGNTSDLSDSALDFLSLLSANLSFDNIAVLYNTDRVMSYERCPCKTKVFISLL